MLDDPAYMSQPMWTATNFKKQADATGFTPVGCDGK
jgi:flagellar biosynthesis component FlhA